MKLDMSVSVEGQANDLEDLTYREVISKDQPLSAHLLKATNFLGFKNTRDMTIAVATRGVYRRFGITERMPCAHSVSAAIGSKTIYPDSQVMMRTCNGGESSIRDESEVFKCSHTGVGSLITGKWNYPKVISRIILQHHRDEEPRPPMKDPGTLKALACVDLSNTICKVPGDAGYSEPRETLDLVDHPALSFLDIPVESASELVPRKLPTGCTEGLPQPLPRLSRLPSPLSCS